MEKWHTNLRECHQSITHSTFLGNLVICIKRLKVFFILEPALLTFGQEKNQLLRIKVRIT
jgi:hypothetical protein